tara:strand:+ start:674 stop:784 length:111 start_codon:yes stop_codon:yes gene_type:complete
MVEAITVQAEWWPSTLAEMSELLCGSWLGTMLLRLN